MVRIFNWVWLLHVLTFYSVMLGFVLAAPPPPKKFEFNRVTIFVILAGVLSIFAPIWMFATPLAGGGSFTGLFWNTLGMIFFSIIACLIVLGKYYSRRITTTERIIQFIFPILFLAVSEVILYDTARAGRIGPAADDLDPAPKYLRDPHRFDLLCLVPFDSNRGHCLVDEKTLHEQKSGSLPQRHLQRRKPEG